MTGEIWIKVLEKLNRHIKEELNRHMILFIDNCPAHPDTGLKFSNVSVIFLPPNTTSVQKPLDAGVIKCFKGSYRLRLCRKLISILGFDKTAENIIEFKKFTPTMIKFYDACEMINSAWSDIASDTIVNTFRHCCFH